jgi:hypothetical protein
MNYKHGLADNHPQYSAWLNMRRRCSNPDHPHYKYYGGRGIRVCKEWECFATYLNDVGERPKGMSLDRIDNNGNYEPGNVRWATKSTQSQNRRTFKSPGRANEKHHNNKLTTAEVVEIRALYATGALTQQALAEKFGCSRRYVGKIVNGQARTYALAR